jgi:hypothetical protein
MLFGVFGIGFVRWRSKRSMTVGIASWKTGITQLARLIAERQEESIDRPRLAAAEMAEADFGRLGPLAKQPISLPISKQAPAPDKRN